MISPFGRSIENLVGKKFGGLEVLSYYGHRSFGTKKKIRQHYWVCKCICGNTCVKQGNHLKNGSTKSCGKKCWVIYKNYKKLIEKKERKHITQKKYQAKSVKKLRTPYINFLLSKDEIEKTSAMVKLKRNQLKLWRLLVKARKELQ